MCGPPIPTPFTQNSALNPDTDDITAVATNSSKSDDATSATSDTYQDELESQMLCLTLNNYYNVLYEPISTDDK